MSEENRYLKIKTLLYFNAKRKSPPNKLSFSAVFKFIYWSVTVFHNGILAAVQSSHPHLSSLSHSKKKNLANYLATAKAYLANFKSLLQFAC